jgi:molybdate transport system substrate-binding protein
MAQSIKVLSSMATRALLVELVERARKALGTEIELESIAGVGAAKKVAEGAVVDVVVLADSAIVDLAGAGWLDSASRTGLVRSSMVAAVRAGAERPDISTEDRLRDAVAAASRVGYSTGPSGQHLLGLLERWDMMAEAGKRLVQAPPGVPVGTLIADGRADLGFQQLSELMDLPGVAVLGALPAPVDHTTVFSGAVALRSRFAAEAGELLRYLTLAEHDDLKRQRGMDPA